MNHYAGDAVLAEFGSVVGCIEIQRRFADENRDVPEDHQLLFRIGIHMPKAINDGDEIYGDGVNIAARLHREDGGGLRLVVSNHGAKKWILRFTINGKRREMGLGSYPDVGLAAARTKASECRRLVKEGFDPRSGAQRSARGHTILHQLRSPLYTHAP